MTILDHMHTSRPSGRSVVLLAFLLIAPVTLAHASLPDQTWVEGIYDRADFDDVVGFLTSSLEATDFSTAPEASACLVLASKLCPATVVCPASPLAYSAPLRAPPIV